MILVKRPDRQIVLATLHKGTEIKSVQSNDLTTFQIIEGKMKFHNRKQSVVLDKGQLLTLQDNIKYRLTTTEETVFLMTIGHGSFQSAEI
jgi:quercetin dioxygenase-like cupin family protein